MLEDRPVLQSRYAGRDEDAKVADVGIGQVDDALPRFFESLCALVDGRDPAQRLVRRRDVVAVGGEDDERIANARQVSNAMRVDLDLSLLKPVADEQVLDDGDHLLAAQPIEAVPPPLEVEKPLLLGVDVREEIGVLIPNGRLRLQTLEVLCQPGAIEAIEPEVCEVVRQPNAAHEAGGNAHGINPWLAGPIGERRAIQYHRPA